MVNWEGFCWRKVFWLLKVRRRWGREDKFRSSLKTVI
jgi:hypothetical protein